MKFLEKLGHNTKKNYVLLKYNKISYVLRVK